MKNTQKSAKSTTATRKNAEAFTDEERAAIKERVRESKAAGDKADGESAVLGKIAEIVPHWMVNRPSDWETGEDVHLFSSDVELRLRDDINRMKMIRCYRGIRHEQGQKVRGQRTRSNGRTGLTVGVIKKTAIAAAKAAKKEEGGEKEKKE